MKKALGYLLWGLGFLILWPLQIGLWIYGLYYIIRTFIDGGVIAGLISIPLVGIILAVVYIIIHILSTPYMALVYSLLAPSGERRQKELWERQQKEQEAEMLAADHLQSAAERRRILAKLGKTSEEIEDEIRRGDEEIHKDLVETFRNQNKPEAALREIDQLRAFIRHHKGRYCKLNSPEISDGAYDYLKQRLRALEEAYSEFVARKGG